MEKFLFRIMDVINNRKLPDQYVDYLLNEGDPVEVDGEMYYVCEIVPVQTDGIQEIGVIPLVVRNPSKVENIDRYLKCLALAHRRVQFLKGEKTCTLEECDEMIIT